MGFVNSTGMILIILYLKLFYSITGKGELYK